MVRSTRREMIVGTWNLLLDKTRTREGLIEPQAARVDSQLCTLGHTGLRFAALCLMEAEESGGILHGRYISEQLGYGAGVWQQHNRKHEHIGLCGASVDTAEFVDLGYNKKAVMSVIGEIAVVGVHLKRENMGSKRAEQTGVMLEHIAGYEKAVVMGDMNALPFEKAPRLMRRNGFQSVFKLTGQHRPATWPSPGYRDVMLTAWQQRLLPSVNYDDIYVRGVKVDSAGTFEGESDHLGVWATIVE